MKTLIIFALSILGNIGFLFSAAAADGESTAKQMTLIKTAPIRGFVLDVEGSIVAKRGSTIVATSGISANSVFTYNLETGVQTPHIVIPTYDKLYYEAPAFGPLIEAKIQPKGDLLLLITDLEYFIYNYKTGAFVQKLDAVTDPRFSSRANQAAWSSSGRFLAFTDRLGKSLRLYDSKTRETRTLRQNLADQMFGFKWSPDETRLLFTESDSTALVIDHLGKIEQKLSWFWTTNGPLFYADWLNNERVKVGNNFLEEYYELKSLRLLGTATSRSNIDLFQGRGVLSDANGKVTTYADLKFDIGVKGYSQPLFHPEFPGQKSFQYRALPGEIFLFDYGSKDNYYFVNADSEVLFTVHRNWGRPDSVLYTGFKMVGDNLVIIDQNSGFQYFQITTLRNCKELLKVK